MERFSVIYTLHDQYYQISFGTHSEADQSLQQVFISEGGTPLGIYDAKTELFCWETLRQQQYKQMTIEEQSRMDNQLVTIAQTLRSQQEKRTLPGIIHQPIYAGLITSL